MRWKVSTAFIASIPMKEGTKNASEFIPISLLNEMYKIIVKVMAIRLSTLIETIISDHQMAATRGRQIQDSILIANELIDNKKIAKEPGLILKLGFFKAFDCTSWQYLDYM